MIVQYNPDPILIMTPNIEWSPEPLIRIDPLIMDERRNTYCNNGTFGWSDFPCQGDDLLPSSASRIEESTSSSSLLSDYIPRTPPLSLPRLKQPIAPPPSPTSCCTIEEEKKIFPSTCKVEMPLSTSERPQERRVRFAPLTRVRTHTLVLGDHPLCSGGMALQLGWESSGTQYVPLRSQQYPKRNLNAFRLTYQQRRDRLQQLTGRTGSQLLHEEYLLVCCGGASATQQQDNCIYDEV
jgi:hypothetical protein